jgi:hypothetical protein
VTLVVQPFANKGFAAPGTFTFAAGGPQVSGRFRR